MEQEAFDGILAYSPAEFLADVRKGIWKELEAAPVKIDAYRRNLQRAYLDMANTKVNGAGPSLPAGLPPQLAGLFAASGDEKPFYRAELKSLNTAVTAALAKTADRETRAHLEGVRDQIAKILDPKFGPVTSNTGPVIRIGFEGFDVFSLPPDQLGTCWPDYAIRRKND